MFTLHNTEILDKQYSIYHRFYIDTVAPRGRGGGSQGFGIVPRVLECCQDFGVAPRVLE